LQGVREAIRQRLDALKVPEGVQTHFVTSFNDEEPSAPGKPFTMSLERYFAGIPKRFRDTTRYSVQRTIHLSWSEDVPGHESVKVYEGDALVWAKDSEKGA
jgi:hypothetical protein